jgi:hypothetical protein
MVVTARIRFLGGVAFETSKESIIEGSTHGSDLVKEKIGM